MKLMNNKRLFNEGWEFAKSSLKTFDSSALAFKTVDIPHDWLIYDTLNLYEDSIGWYRKTFTYIKNEKQVLLCFDGVYMDDRSKHGNRIFPRCTNLTCFMALIH